jgi:hypothetical protein
MLWKGLNTGLMVVMLALSSRRRLGAGAREIALSQHQHDDHDGRQDASEDERYRGRADVGVLHSVILAHHRGRK